MTLRFSEVSCFQTCFIMDKYFKHCGYFGLRTIFTAIYLHCRVLDQGLKVCCGREPEQSQYPILVHRLLQLLQMGSDSLESSTAEGQGTIRGNSGAVLLPSCLE